MSPSATLAALDLAALRAARTVGHAPALERTVARYTLAGQHAALWIALGAAGMLADRPRRAPWRRATLTVAGAYVANQALKLVVGRPRPPGQLVGTPTQRSFPSAHATTSFAAVQAFAGLIPDALLRTVAVTLAGSRVYLGVHYPSDVLAGAALGTLIGKVAR